MTKTTPDEASSRARLRDLTGAGSLAGRIALSDGSELADPREPGDARYHESAIVPKGAWRTPRPGELARLCAPAGAPDAEDVLVVGLADLVHAVRTTLPETSDPGALLAAARSADFHEALTERVDDLVPFCRKPEGIRFIGPSVSRPGQRTCTVDRAREPLRRVGLHVDSWDGREPRARATSRRRLCVNAGSSARYFLFVPDRISSLAERADYAAASVDLVATAFLAANPDAPIVRVRIDPGEAYVACTEDLIHDGSTEDAGTLDLSLQFLGHFGAPEEEGRSWTPRG